jgi:signal transduction histidine kinase
MLLAISIIILILAIVLIILAYRVRANTSVIYEFVSIISHKFRTPLTSTKWLVDNLVSTEKDSFRKKDLDDVHTLNQQLINLTNTLVELTDSEKSSKQQYNFEKISVCEFVRTVFKPISEQFGMKNISCSINCADENLKINVDKARFEFVLHSVLENSAIYTKPGGKVDVVIESAAGKVYVTVVDNGIGIPKSNLRFIFSEFHRAPNAKAVDTEGLGVDLYLSRRIIHRLNGEIKAYSEGEGKGSTFQIILPQVQ